MLSTDSWPMDLTALYLQRTPRQAEDSSSSKALDVSDTKQAAGASLPVADDAEATKKIAA